MEPTREWLDEGTELFLSEADVADLHAPSLLPDWTRGHVVGHVARNAEAIGRLLSWVRTGVETPMYPQDRDADIERTAQGEPAVIRADARDTAATLRHTLDSMSAPDWAREVENSRGFTLSAAMAVWMRTVEVWLHSVDLGTGVTFDRLPPGLCERLVDEVGRTASADWPTLRLTATDSGRVREFGGTGAAVQVSATTSELAAWLTGRTTRPEAELPAWP